MNFNSIANKWRKQHPERSNGVVLIWMDKVYGWKNALRNPEQERPGAIAVDTNNNVFIASGGNEYDGAECWLPCN